MRTEALIATVDVRELNTLGRGPLRDTFPAYAGEIELARYLKQLLQSGDRCAVRIEPHSSEQGHPSSHVFDIYRIRDAAAA